MEADGLGKEGLRNSPQHLYAFPKSKRILKTSDYRKTYEEGERLSNREFLLFFRKGTQVHTRLGISVTKALGKAVKRNYYKRVLREVLRTHYNEFVPGKDIVVVAKKEILNQPFSKIQESLLSLFKKANLIRFI